MLIRFVVFEVERRYLGMLLCFVLKIILSVTVLYEHF